MTKKFQYVPSTQASWVEHLYHTTIEVKNGVAEIDANDVLSEMYLLNHSFVPVDQPVTAEVDEPKMPVKATRKNGRKTAAKAASDV